MKLIPRSFMVILMMFAILTVGISQASIREDVAINRNGVLLKGKFHVSEGIGPFPTILLLNGLPGNETDVLGLGELLSASGINALTINYSGTFQSQGEMSFANTQLDIEAALGFLYQKENVIRYKIENNKIFLGGWCYGGGMALAYAAGHPEIKDVISIAGNDHGEFMREYIRNLKMRKMIDVMFAEIGAPAGPVRFAKGALPKEMADAGIDNLNPIFDLRKSAPLLARKNLLLICGWDDAQVTIDQFILPFYRALENEKAKNVKIVAFQDDHYFKNSRKEIAQIITEWLRTAPQREMLK